MLIAGTEKFLHSLIARCQTDFSYLTATLTPLRMAPALRENAAAALMPPSKFNVSFVMGNSGLKLIIRTCCTSYSSLEGTS